VHNESANAFMMPLARYVPLRPALSVLSVVLCAATWLAAPLSANARETVLIFAAASTREAILSIAKLADDDLGIDLKASFAGSSALARQIESGAPADLFLSANAAWMDYLAASNAIEPRSRRDLIRNRLVLIAPAGSVPAGVPDPLSASADLGSTLAGRRLAIAEPDSVPAGIYAKQALNALGLWAAVSHRLAPSADVRTALALVERGEAPLGIVYATDARAAPGVSVVSMIPDGSHQPIVYPIALTANGALRQAAQKVLALFLSESGLAAFSARGFEPALQ
jgi:molybdate transport system substrate-binding protein